MTNTDVYKYVISFVLLVATNGNQVPRPRGTSLSRASLYDPGKDFVCLDGSLSIPFSQVNDDFCDCVDGTDEPGTSACPTGVFYCTNAGYKSLSIPSSRVNDGICDCCDASDEYANPNSRCANNCNELGRSARVEAQKKAELIKMGSQIRTEYSQKGVLVKLEKKEKLLVLSKNKNEVENIKAEKELLKTNAEKLENDALQQYRQIEEDERKQKTEEEENRNKNEAHDVFVKYDSNADGKVSVVEMQTRKIFDRDNDGQVSDGEAQYFLNDKSDVDFEEFYPEAWQKIKPYFMLESGIYSAPATEAQDMAEVEAAAEEMDLGEDDEDDNDNDDELETEPVETGEKHQYDEETQKLIDAANEARNQLAAAEKSYLDIQNEIRDTEEFLQKDYGADEEYLVLENQCFEYTDREYVYKLCPFSEVTQRPKSGGSETRLGTWGRWVGEHNKYEAMLYDRGASCWNGPQRSAHVQVACGNDNVITGVSEPNRCEYVFDFVSPAACNPALIDELNEDVHDEL